MAEFRFIHCADLHLGSRFAGFASRDSVLAEKLAQSPWEALKRLVNRAVADKVDFVTIGGDVFEEFSPPLPVWQKFLSFMEKLSDAGIEVFICTGNHDPLDSAWKYASSLPEKVKLFPAGAVFHPVEKADSTIAYVGGISYQSASAPADYASRIIKVVPDDDIPKFALLHTEVDGSVVSPYAPVPLAELCGAKVSGWLLGHVHSKAVLSEQPLVIYPGVLQGRAVDEPGLHYAAEITFDRSGRCRSEFICLSPYRFESICVDISGAESISETVAALRKATSEYLKSSEAVTVFRLKLCGTTELDKVLRMENSEDLRDMLLPALNGKAFLEKIIIATRAGRKGELPAEAAEEIDRALEQLIKSDYCSEVIAQLKKSCRGIPDFSAEEIAGFYREAQERLLDKLSPENSGE